MSWIDLAALMLLFRNAAAGYLDGIQRALLRLGLTLGSLPLAYIFYRPLLFYLNRQWQAEKIFVEWYIPRAQNVLAAVRQREFFLPPLAGKIMLFLSPDAAVLPVSAVNLPPLWGKLLLQFLAYLLFVVFCAAAVRLLLYFRGQETAVKVLTEKERLAGLFAGAAYGLLLAVFAGAFLDSLSLLFVSRFWENDFYGTYLEKTAAYLLGKIFGG